MRRGRNSWTLEIGLCSNVVFLCMILLSISIFGCVGYNYSIVRVRKLDFVTRIDHTHTFIYCTKYCF
jgi:hypothetical protein